jgi:hypothetical protein
MKKYLILAILAILLIIPTVSSALELTYPRVQNLEIRLDMNLNELIAWFYYFIVGISGLAAFSMLVWGGFTWLTSAGSSSKTGEAKERISSAVLGLMIILSSWVILRLINPELTIIRLPTLH